MNSNPPDPSDCAKKLHLSMCEMPADETESFSCRHSKKMAFDDLHCICLDCGFIVET